MAKVYVVGIGPGAYEQMTMKAVDVLKSCDVLIGYTVYIDLVKKYFPEKRYLTTPMTQEVRRCEMAYEEAKKGNDTAMICSGDAGIYGMAALMYELHPKYPEVELSVIPGVTAANAGAAVLGAPLNHDFAVISLSDLLTPYDRIMERVKKAAEADFAICLYNPSSKKRHKYLAQACEQILKFQSPDTICGIVQNIGRKGEEMQVMTLLELQRTEVDMFTTVYIGNSQTKRVDSQMVTPRGYSVK